MKSKLLNLGLLLAIFALAQAARAQTPFRWTAVATPAPDNLGTILLLGDGTVLAQNGSTNIFKLTPDSSGHYVNGTWSTLASSTYEHYYAGTVVLRNGKVCVVGGEYGGGSSYAEVYDSSNNVWTTSSAFSVDVADGNGVLLRNDLILLEPQGAGGNGNTYTLNPADFTLTQTIGAPLYNMSESSWVKLPNDNILTVASGGSPSGSTNVEQYNPNTGTWVSAYTSGTVPNIWPNIAASGDVSEMGPGFLLPNGNAIFFGGNGKTAVYSNGNWLASATIPNGQVCADTPGAMMVNGKILLAVSPAITGNGAGGNGPISFYEYDYTANSGAGGYTQVDAPTGDATFPGGTGVGAPGTEGLRMLALPDGTIMMSGVSSNVYIYTPTGSPLAAGQPTILSVTANGSGGLHLTGTLFNGISQGATYGDDAQADSNYPLVRFTDAGGTVRYGRSFNWSSTSVMTGSAVVSTESTIPAGASLNDTIQVVANGNPSAGVHYPLYNSGSTVFVDYSFGGTELGTQANPYKTIHNGVSHAANGGVISIHGGHSTTGGDGHIRIATGVRIVANNGTASIGPN